MARGGKRVRLLEASIKAPDGAEVVRARALQVRAADAVVPRTALSPPPGAPAEGRENDYVAPYRPMFARGRNRDSVRRGRFLRWSAVDGVVSPPRPLVGGEAPSPLQRLAAAGDFGNGISSVLPWAEYVFINPDLTLYIEREPIGEWVALEAQTLIAPEGIGTSESILYDERGRVGRATQVAVRRPRADALSYRPSSRSRR